MVETRASGLWTAVDGHVHRGNHRDSAIGLSNNQPLAYTTRGDCSALTHLVLGPSDARVSRRPPDHGSMAAVWLRRLPRASLVSAASSTLHLCKEFGAFSTRRRLGRV